MLSTEYQWLLASVRPAATERAHLARRSFTTIAVATFCLLCAFVQPATAPAPDTIPATPVVAALEPTPAAWPTALVRLWFILPQLLPRG